MDTGAAIGFTAVIVYFCYFLFQFHIFHLPLTGWMFQPIIIAGPGNFKDLAHLRNTEQFRVFPDKTVVVYYFFVKMAKAFFSISRSIWVFCSSFFSLLFSASWGVRFSLP